MVHKLELAIAALEKEYEKMWAQTRGVRRSGAREDLDRLGSQIDRYKAELAEMEGETE